MSESDHKYCMACGCANDQKRNIGPVRQVRTTAFLFEPEGSSEEKKEPEKKEPPKETLPKRVIKFM